MDLLYTLAIVYLAKGEMIESEMQLLAPQCEAAANRINRDIKGPRKHRPMVDLVNGKRAPILSATCIRACMDQHEPEPLSLLKDGDA